MRSEDALYSERRTFKAPTRLVSALDYAAERKCVTSSEYIRGAVMARLEADGVDVVSGLHIAPALTPWLDQGAQQFALVDGDAVFAGVAESVPDGDRRTWLPVFNADAQPFDPRTMYREKPYLKRDGDRVYRIYPIRLKSESMYASDL